MAHSHRYTIPVVLGGELLGHRCTCGAMSLGAPVSTEVGELPILYRPVSVILGQVVDDVVESVFREATRGAR